MSKFRVITDGSGDLSPELIKERDITVVPFYVMLGSGDYLKQDADIGTPEFYEWMVSHPGVYPKSSTPSTQDYLKVFREDYDLPGIEILHHSEYILRLIRAGRLSLEHGAMRS